MKKIIFSVLVFLFCGKVFPQSDSVINFNTGNIFSVEYVNADSTESRIKEAGILSLSDFGLMIKYKIDNTEYVKNIDLEKIRKIGYKKGDNGWKYAGLAFVGTIGVMFIAGNVFKIKSKGDHSGGNPYADLLLVASIPVVAGLIGGIAAVFENNYITIIKSGWKVRIEKVINIPLTFGGRAAFMIQNVLAATLAAYLQGLTTEDIKFGLTTFVPGTAQTPGRLNLIEVGEFKVLIDFAHNPAGMEALSKFVDKFPNKVKIGVVAGTGDRRDEDIIKLGTVVGKMFTKVVIRQDDNLRGRATADEISDLLLKGILKANPDIKHKVIPDEVEAIEFALSHTKKNELLVLLPDDIPRCIQIVNKFRENYNPVKVENSDIPNQ